MEQTEIAPWVEGPWVGADYWKGEYRGEELPEEEFLRLEAAAQRYVDRQTFGRIDPENMTESDFRRVKDAVCAVIEAMRVNSRGGSVSAESIGEYSVTYTAGISKAKTDSQRLKDALALYLGDTGLLYRGAAKED